MATIADLVGNTPLVELKKLNPNPNVQIFGKLEGHNPGGSVKDRAALSMIQGALNRGDVQPGGNLIEATSGNTGIALAMIARLALQRGGYYLTPALKMERKTDYLDYYKGKIY